MVNNTLNYVGCDYNLQEGHPLHFPRQRKKRQKEESDKDKLKNKQIEQTMQKGSGNVHVPVYSF